MPTENEHIREMIKQMPTESELKELINKAGRRERVREFFELTFGTVGICIIGWFIWSMWTSPNRNEPNYPTSEPCIEYGKGGPYAVPC